MRKTSTARTKTASKARVIPTDDEPLTRDDFKAIREANDAFVRGDYCTLDELKADLDSDVARLRAHKGSKRPPAKRSR